MIKKLLINFNLLDHFEEKTKKMKNCSRTAQYF